MQVDEYMAKYVLRLIADKESYRDLTIADKEMQKLLREAFPTVVTQLEMDAFAKWVRSVMVNGEESVVQAEAEVKTLIELLQHAQDTNSSSLASDCLQDELTEKVDVLQALKWKVFDHLMSDPELSASLKRKWLEVTSQVSPLPPSDVAPSADKA